jgi:hypothetical protein
VSGDESVDQLGLDVLGLGDWRLEPSDQQLVAVTELPDVSTTPVDHWLTRAVI